jgi:hypothetical protein
VKKVTKKTAKAKKSKASIAEKRNLKLLKKLATPATTLEVLPEALPFIREVVMHQNPHWDEVVAYYLWYQYGDKKFQNTKGAAIRFVESDPVGTDEEFDKDGILPIGCGKGRFDEHREGVERLEGECATTLVAKYLGIRNKPELERLIDETLHFDTHEGCASTQLPEILKRAHRNTSDNYATMDWALLPIAAMVRLEKYHYAKRKGEKNLVDIMKESVEKGLYTEDPRIQKRMTDLLQQSEQDKERSITELAYVLQALYRNGYDEDAISSWLVTPLDQIVTDQIEFWKEVEICKTRKVRKIIAKIDNQEFALRLIVCRSDSLHAQKAARYLGANVVLVRNSRGNVQIYIDTRIRGLSLRTAAKMIRWLEPSRDSRNVRFSKLGYVGKGSETDLWYYFEKAEMLFNGTMTQVERPTQIKIVELVNVLQHAFHPYGIAKWCKKYGVPAEETKQA